LPRDPARKGLFANDTEKFFTMPENYSKKEEFVALFEITAVLRRN